MIISFDENLLTGNKLIDEQHKELFARMEHFADVCENGDGKVEAIQMLSYLSEYTDFHFNAEEALQKEANYPEYEGHLAKHVIFKKNLSDLKNFLDEIDGPNEEFVKAVENNVVNWFMYHIQTFDRSVAEYLNLNNNSELL